MKGPVVGIKNRNDFQFRGWGKVYFIFSLFMLLSVPLALKSQVSAADKYKIDSLNAFIKTTANDTLLVKALFALDDIVFVFDSKSDLQINQRIVELCRRKIKESTKNRSTLFYKQSLGRSLNNIGIHYQERSEFGIASDYFHMSIKVQKEIGNKIGVCKSLNNLGIISNDLGDRTKSIDYYMQSLKIAEEMEDPNNASTCLNNIGMIYEQENDYAKAISYFERSVEIMKDNGNKFALAGAINNIGSVYCNQGNDDMAEVYFLKSLAIRNEIGDKVGISGSYTNLALIHKRKGDYKKAIAYNLKCLELEEEIGYKQGIVLSYLNLASVYHAMNDLDKSVEYNLKGIKIGNEIGVKFELMNGYGALYGVYKEQGKHKLALEAHVRFIDIRDSLESEKSRNEIVRQEFKYKYEKKAMADSLRTGQEKKVTSTKLQHEALFRYALYIGLCLIAIFSVFMFNRFRIARKQKRIIEDQKIVVENQKELVEAKQKEVMDSIHYAKRIQQALLPSQRYMDRNFNRLKGDTR